MEKTKASIWAEFDVGKARFSASLDHLTENGKAKVATLPYRDFKRTPEGIELIGLAPQILYLDSVSSRNSSAVDCQKQKENDRTVYLYAEMLLMLRAMVIHKTIFDEDFFKKTSKIA